MLTIDEFKKIFDILGMEEFRYKIDDQPDFKGQIENKKEYPNFILWVIDKHMGIIDEFIMYGCDYLIHPKKFIYSYFLQKVIEGIIKKYGFQFDAFYNKIKQEWDYMFFNKPNTQYPESKGLLKHINNVTTNKDIDQAKEQAIKYILEQL